MKARIVSFRRSRRRQNTRQIILKVEGITTKKKTKEITGEIKNLEEMLNELTSGIPVEKNLATEVIAETFDSMINGKKISIFKN